MKVFPCAQIGGAGYIRALKAPFPHVSMIASGGVTQQNAAEFIRAGAVAIGVGQHLVPQKAIDKREADWIRELARRFVTIVKETRAILLTNLSQPGISQCAREASRCSSPEPRARALRH